MGKPVAVLIVGLFLAVFWAGCKRGHVLDEAEARHLAQKVAEQDATRMGIARESVKLKDFDGSGKVVRWFFSFESTASPEYLVAILMDEYGRYEMHRGGG